MPEKFKLYIQLETQKMRTPSDVAKALRAIADRIDGTEWDYRSGGAIEDDSGNAVGRWGL